MNLLCSACIVFGLCIDLFIAIGHACVLGDVSSEHEKKEARQRFAFKTKSEVEVLDDGYKWRKYGKKMVKDSPNPRYT